MSRRSAPPSSGPAYIPHPSTYPHRSIASEQSGAFSQYAHTVDVEAVVLKLTLFVRFIENEIMAPDKLPGNLSILTGVGMFIGGIMAVRAWGELMIPA